MSKTISRFRFKHFSVSHHRSAMKVGVDGVLIGCWTETGNAKRILDVGTGCGLIALIMAQRTPGAFIEAIDVDEPSIEEASENFSVSPWSERVRAFLCNYCDVRSLLKKDEGFDLIVSNPPYFDSGVTEIESAREKARHQGELSPLSLLSGAKDILNPGGSVAMVLPCDLSTALEEEARNLGYSLLRKCLVRGHKEAPYKRALIQWIYDNGLSDQLNEVPTEYLTLESSPNIPTDLYRELCKDFYLKF
ncbi:MAG: methyltransferase [Muribaculaceae bacterium]|nr:methyltransferase [Muribaculaceae bacterium]